MICLMSHLSIKLNLYFALIENLIQKIQSFTNASLAMVKFTNNANALLAMANTLGCITGNTIHK